MFDDEENAFSEAATVTFAAVAAATIEALPPSVNGTGALTEAQARGVEAGLCAALCTWTRNYSDILNISPESAKERLLSHINDQWQHSCSNFKPSSEQLLTAAPTHPVGSR